MATTSVRTVDAYRTEPRSHPDFLALTLSLFRCCRTRSSGSISGLTRRLFRSCGDARSLSLCCFCGWLFCNRRLLSRRLLGRLTRRLFRSCGGARSLSLCCFCGWLFCSRRLLLFLWQRGRWLRLPFYRCRPLSCCANRGTRECPNHRSNDRETHDRPGYSTSNCATQGAPSGARGFVSRVLFLVVVHVRPPKLREDARPLEPTCQRALSFYSLARAGRPLTTLSRRLLLGASR